MKCNYDHWGTPVVKRITEKMINVLRVMADGEHRLRADMLRAAGIEPNPRSANGFPSSEYTDYYLYKKCLLRVVGTKHNGAQKIFEITNHGRTVLNEHAHTTNPD